MSSVWCVKKSNLQQDHEAHTLTVWTLNLLTHMRMLDVGLKSWSSLAIFWIYIFALVGSLLNDFWWCHCGGLETSVWNAHCRNLVVVNLSSPSGASFRGARLELRWVRPGSVHKFMGRFPQISWGDGELCLISKQTHLCSFRNEMTKLSWSQMEIYRRSW